MRLKVCYFSLTWRKNDLISLRGLMIVLYISDLFSRQDRKMGDWLVTKVKIKKGILQYGLSNLNLERNSMSLIRQKDRMSSYNLFLKNTLLKEGATYRENPYPTSLAL